MAARPKSEIISELVGEIDRLKNNNTFLERQVSMYEKQNSKKKDEITELEIARKKDREELGDKSRTIHDQGNLLKHYQVKIDQLNAYVVELKNDKEFLSFLARQYINENKPF